MVKSGVGKERGHGNIESTVAVGERENSKQASPGYGTVIDSVADTSGLVLCASLSLNNWPCAVEH